MNNTRNIIILLIAISMNVSGQIIDYITHLNGSVKQIINRESSYSGWITIVEDYNPSSFLKVKSVYNGNMIHKDSLKTRHKYTYKLDNKKRISEILIVSQDKSKCKKIIKYKPSLYTINTLWKVKGRWKSYDGVDRFTNHHKEYKTKVVLELGMFHEYYQWNKDKTQLSQMRFETDEEGWEEYMYNYTYNDKNLLIHEEYQTQIDSVFEIKFYTDSSGNIYNENEFRFTKSNSFNTKYKYDEHDNCIEVKKIHHDSSVCITTFQFQYDEKSNWIKKEEYIDGILRDTKIREIIYFN